MVMAPERYQGSRPARVSVSSFGNDEDLVGSLPPNWTLKEFQEHVRKALREYFEGASLDEAARRVRQLLIHCPTEADEFGVLSIRISLDYNELARRQIVDLFGRLIHTNIMDRSALVRSFEKVYCAWEDIIIDAPKAPGVILMLAHTCVAEGLLPQSCVTKCPEALAKAVEKDGMPDATPAQREKLHATMQELHRFKAAVAKMIEGYYFSLAIEEVVASLEDLNMPDFHHEFVKKAIIVSYSQTSAETSRESALALFRHLTAEGQVTKDDLQWGITRILGQIDDLILDYPHAVVLSTDFFSALVKDELVSVPFLKRCRLLRIGGATGLKVLDGTFRKTPEYSKQHLGTPQFKAELSNMIIEFFDSGDQAEFARLVRELQPLAEARAAELVRKVMSMAMERTPVQCKMAIEVLTMLDRQEEITPEAMERGFTELDERMPDFMLDVPDAEDQFANLIEEAMRVKILRRSWPDPQEL